MNDNLTIMPEQILLGGKRINNMREAKFEQSKMLDAFECYIDGLEEWEHESEYNRSVKNLHSKMHDCGTQLDFAVDHMGRKKLIYGNYCHDRLCPVCQRKLAEKNAREAVAKIEHQKAKFTEAGKPDFELIMLTLTVPNVTLDDLRSEIRKMGTAFTKMLKRKHLAVNKKKSMSEFVLGGFRSVEFTYNKTRDDFHPHIHVLLAMDSTYFYPENMIKQNEWQAEWEHALGYPQAMVDVRKIRQKNGELSDYTSAVLETCKYVMKHKSLLNDVPFEEQCDFFMSLRDSLKNLRLHTAFGIFSDENNADMLLLPEFYDDVDDFDWSTAMIYRYHYNRTIDEYVLEEKLSLTEYCLFMGGLFEWLLEKIPISA